MFLMLSILNGANLTPTDINIDFAVFPAANLYMEYCLYAKWSGFSSFKSSNNISKGLT